MFSKTGLRSLKIWQRRKAHKPLDCGYTQYIISKLFITIYAQSVTLNLLKYKPGSKKGGNAICLEWMVLTKMP